MAGPPSSQQARLTVLSGPMSGKELVLEEVVDNILIGSDSSCRFHLALPGISPIHARIWMDAAGVTVYDTHSPRGLYVNDDRVNGQAPLQSGDILWLGTPGEDEAVMVQVRLPPREASAAAPEPVAPPPHELTGETVMLNAPPVAAPPEPEVLEVVDEEAPEELESAADATMVMAPEEVEAGEAPADATIVMSPAEEIATPAEPASDATVLEMPALEMPAPVDEFYVAPPEPPAPEAPAFAATQALSALEEEPVRFAVDLPPIPATPPPEAAFFEDELQEPAAEATMILPDPPPALAQPVVPPPRLPAPPPPTAPPPTARADTAPPTAPRPAAEVRAARPAPRSPAPTPAPAATAIPVPAAAPRERAAPSASGRYAAFGAVGLALLVGGGFAVSRVLQRPAATPTPETTIASAPVAPPESIASAPPQTAPPTVEPPIEEAVTIVKSPPPSTQAAANPTPAARPTASPSGKTVPVATPPPVAPEVAHAQQTAAQVATLLGQADAAAAARSFDSAAGLFDEILKLDPQNAKAAEGKTSVQAALASLKKTFVPGKTSVQSGTKSASKGGMAGFDSEDVSLAKAPDYSGRIEFEATPKNVKAGDSYTVLVYLTNDGKKSFKLGSVNVTTAANGAKSGGAVQPKAKSADPQQRVLLAELPGVWQAGTNSWSTEVVVTSDHNDTFKNTLAWK